MADVVVASSQKDQRLGSAGLLQLTQTIAHATTLSDWLPIVVRDCALHFGVDYVRVIVLNQRHQPFVVSVPEPNGTPSTSVLNPVLEQVLQTAEMQVIQAEALVETDGPYARFQSVLLLPLTAHKTTLGVLELASSEESREWSAEEHAFAQVVAGQLALAIANIDLQASSNQRDQEITTLNDIAATITSTLDPRQVYRLVVQKINEYFRVEAGSLLLLDPQTDELVFVMTLEAGAEKLAGVRVPPGQGLVGEVIRTRQPVVVLDAQNDPRFYKKVSEDVGFITRSSLCVPMLVKGREIGVIQLLNKVEGDFDNDDVTRLSAMANTIAVAIDNATLFQEVAQNRNRLQAILNSTEDGILTIDMDDVVVTANPMIERLFGLMWHKLVGQQGSEILNQILERTRPISEPLNVNPDIIELEILKPHTGFVRQVNLPVFNANNEQIGKLIVFHDITEERELASIREDYTGMLVHDLRAPLTAIINGMTMVRRGFAGPINDQQRELLDIANNSSQEMVGMINTLLDISKMEAGELVLNRAPCSVYEIVERGMERLVTSARTFNIDLQQDMALNLPILDADQDKLVRVLQNLLDNAIKFTPVNGSVSVQVRLVDDEPDSPAVRWSVIDTGPGIPETYRLRIFDKFVQVGQKKGTGLGLTFAKLATEAHGGRIWVDSIEGQGSTFSFTIPFTPA
ncbi:MAG: GAF domain-containing protein [Herpetosiphonaceae bacterium]|nr:GAF domain-containing protein [Herpetosiphonaceae bacterium]